MCVPIGCQEPALSRPRARRLLLAALAVVAVALGLELLLDARAARAALVDARAATAAAASALGAGEHQQAHAAVGDARTHIDQARRRAAGPAWAVVGATPLAGRSVDVVRGVVDVADAAIAVAAAAVERGEDLLGPDGPAVAVTARDGQVDLAPLELAQDAAGELPVGQLRAATARLADAHLTWVPETLREARRDVLALARSSLRTVERARLATELLPGLLGADGAREYLVAVQTNAELRGTGGLIGFVTLLTVDDGRFALEAPVVYEAIGEADDAGHAPVVPGFGSGEPAATSEEFTARYGIYDADSLLSNVNVDPDGPTTAQVLHELYASRTGRSPDGVLLLDPVALELLLGAIGDVPIPEAVRVEPAIPAVVPADQVAEWAMIDVYDVLGAGRAGEREPFLQAFGLSMFQQVFTGSWDGIAVARQVARAAGERHLQLYSVDPHEQQQLVRLGIAGAMAPVRPGDDLLAVTANNAVGGKMDVHVAHRITGEIGLRLDPVGDRGIREAGLEVTVDNPLPASGRDPYIIGNCDITQQPGRRCFTGTAGLNRTWFSVWAPGDNWLGGAHDADGERITVGSDRIHGHRVWDHYLSTPHEASNSFTLEASGPVRLQRDGPDLVYSLTLWRQAKAIPDHWDLTISPPDGWDVAEVSVLGGGSGNGMGVGGDGQPLSVDLGGGDAARLTGAATEDVALQVRFTRSLRTRVTEWLSRPLF